LINTLSIYSIKKQQNLTPKGTKGKEMQTLRQQHWFMQSGLCGMGSLRLGSIQLDPRSYEPGTAFCGGEDY